MRRTHQCRSRFRPLGGFLVLAAGIAVWGAADAAAASTCYVDQPGDAIPPAQPQPGELRYCVDEVNQGNYDRIDIVASQWYMLERPLRFEQPAIVVGWGELVMPGEEFVGDNLIEIGFPCAGTCGDNAQVELVGLEISAFGITGVRGIHVFPGHHLTLSGVRMEGFEIVGDGGCVRAGNASELMIAGSTFQGCSATDGGAIFSDATNTIIEDSELRDNIASWAGGAVAIRATPMARSLEVRRSIFHGNLAQRGGALSAGDDMLTAQVVDSELVANMAFESGGAVLGRGLYDRCTFLDNFAGDSGGGLRVVAGGNVMVRESTLSNNKARIGAGVALLDNGDLLVERSTFVGNRAKDGDNAVGGGLAVAVGNAVVANSTFSANEAYSHGAVPNARGGGLAVFDSAMVEVRHATFGDNVADEGGGIYAGPDVELTLLSSMVAYSTGDDCVLLKGITTETSMDSDGTCQVDFPSIDPYLQPLDDNGGPTLTRMPEMGSDMAACHELIDQRREPRPNNDCDIGALER